MNPPPMRTILHSLLFLLVLSGCYHLGSPSQLKFKRLYIAPVENDTYVPQAQAILSSQLRKQLLREGRIVVSSLEQADAVLTVTLTKYQSSIVATQEEETGLAKSFNFSLSAQCDLYCVQDKEYLLSKKTVTSSIVTLVDGGVQLAEYQSIPPLIEKLAHSIKEVILNPW